MYFLIAIILFLPSVAYAAASDSSSFFATVWDAILNFFKLATEDTLRFIFYICIGLFAFFLIMLIVSKIKGRRVFTEPVKAEEGSHDVEGLDDSFFEYVYNQIEKQAGKANKTVVREKEDTRRDKGNMPPDKNIMGVGEYVWQDIENSSLRIKNENPSIVVERIFNDAAKTAYEKAAKYMSIGQYKLAVQFFEEYSMFCKTDEQVLDAEMKMISCHISANKYAAAELRIMQLKKKGLKFSQNQIEKLNQLLIAMGSDKRL